MYNFIMTVGTGNCRVCGKQVMAIAEFVENRLYLNMREKR